MVNRSVASGLNIRYSRSLSLLLLNHATYLKVVPKPTYVPGGWSLIYSGPLPTSL